MWNYQPIRDTLLREVKGKANTPVPPVDNIYRTQNSMMSGSSDLYPTPVVYPNNYITALIIQNPATNAVNLQLGYGSGLNPPAGTPPTLAIEIPPGYEWVVDAPDLGKPLFMRGASSTSIPVWVISERVLS